MDGSLEFRFESLENVYSLPSYHRTGEIYGVEFNMSNLFRT
jgi:hypothetical protein